jgi:hypothetical protein
MFLSEHCIANFKRIEGKEMSYVHESDFMFPEKQVL